MVIVMENSALRAFEESVALLYSQDRPATFWRCRPSFDRLLRSNFLVELVSTQVDHSIPDQGYKFRRKLSTEERTTLSFVVSLHESSGHILISNGLRIDIILLDSSFKKSQPENILGHMMLGYSSTQPYTSLTLELFRLPDGHKNRIFDRTAPLRWQRDCSLEPADIFEVDAGKELCRISKVSGSAVVMRLRSNQILDFSWRYDEKSLLPVQAISMTRSPIASILQQNCLETYRFQRL
jgi:hypothetical protein